jgi:sulfite reductase beta subunit-like hemoprotein
MAVLGHTLLVKISSLKLACAITHKPSEVAFIGKAPGTYLMLLGGGYYGQRLNKIYRGRSKYSHIPPISSLNLFILVQRV